MVTGRLSADVATVVHPMVIARRFAWLLGRTTVNCCSQLQLHPLNEISRNGAFLFSIGCSFPHSHNLRRGYIYLFIGKLRVTTRNFFWKLLYARFTYIKIKARYLRLFSFYWLYICDSGQSQHQTRDIFTQVWFESVYIILLSPLFFVLQSRTFGFLIQRIPGLSNKAGESFPYFCPFYPFCPF